MECRTRTFRGVERLEKRLKRVQRWIDRCVEACRCKAWTSALAELECARAELDSASREIWEIAEGSKAENSSAWSLPPGGTLVHVLAVAAFILLLAGAPTSTESFNPSRPVALEPGPLVEWVTADEKVLLDNLRKSLAGGTAASASPSAAGARPVTRGAGPYQAKSSSFQQQAAPVSPRIEAPVQPEDLLSLIQVGQRALRPDGEGLKIERP